MTTEDDGARSARPTGPGEPAEATTPTIEHPDAKLLRLAREIADASTAGNTVATDEEAEPFLDLATDLRHQLAEIPARTLDGVIAKFDDYRRIHEGGATSVWDKDLLRTIREGLERVGAAASLDRPDAALQGLWRKYLQVMGEWSKTTGDTAEFERCGQESAEIAERISATPAQGIIGLAVKIMIAANEPLQHEALANQTTLEDKALISARDDAVRLTGIGGV